jgi:hypothetical protein
MIARDFWETEGVVFTDGTFVSLQLDSCRRTGLEECCLLRDIVAIHPVYDHPVVDVQTDDGITTMLWKPNKRKWKVVEQGGCVFFQDGKRLSSLDPETNVIIRLDYKFNRKGGFKFAEFSLCGTPIYCTWREGLFLSQDDCTLYHDIRLDHLNESSITKFDQPIQPMVATTPSLKYLAFVTTSNELLICSRPTNTSSNDGYTGLMINQELTHGSPNGEHEANHGSICGGTMAQMLDRDILLEDGRLFNITDKGLFELVASNIPVMRPKIPRKRVVAN